MVTYTLISKAKPKLQDGQETRLYEVMEELGGGPLTMDQIEKGCEYRRYRALMKAESSIRKSEKPYNFGHHADVHLPVRKLQDSKLLHDHSSQVLWGK